ncbi:MAG: efflux RND transporter periplasmic adaptor subunit [Candidatus Roizmanbacteria bacterium]|nr:efflux RND transporter periplasmic adaptor subunit [Candidatus Roizmanbacteria bacterium]
MANLHKNIFGFLKKRWYVVLIIVIGVGFYLSQQRTAQAKKEKESTYIIKRQDLKETLSLSGQIEADEHVVLRFQTSGRLAWVGAKVGDTVKKYQTVATLDQREVKKRLEKSLLTYAQTRNSFDQTGSDNQRIGDQPTNDLDLGDKMKRLLENAQYGLNSSVLDVEITNLSIEYSNLFTPIAGLVTRADAKYAGLNITPSQAEFEIINPETVYFAFTADQTEITKLSDGMKGEMTFDAFPDQNKDGELYYISYTPKSGETGTVYEGRMRISSNTLTQYRYGMTGDVNFTLSEKSNVVSIPSNYVKSDTKGKYVTKISNGKSEKTYITVGPEIDSFYEIKKGLEEGDTISISL